MNSTVSWRPSKEPGLERVIRRAGPVELFVCGVRSTRMTSMGGLFGQAGRKAAPPDSGTRWRRLVLVAPAERAAANYAVAKVPWRDVTRLRIAVSTTSGWESIGTWLLSIA